MLITYLVSKFFFSEINALLAKDAAYTTTELPLKQKYILFCIVKIGEGESEFCRRLKSVPCPLSHCKYQFNLK